MIKKLDLTNEQFNPEIIMNSGQVFRMTVERSKDKSGMAPDLYEARSGNCQVNFYFNREAETWDFICEDKEWDFWNSYFDFDTDYHVFNEAVLASSDLFLKEALKSAFGMRILRQDLWETIISYMISQNNNIPKIKKCIQVLCDRYSDGVRFPSAQVLADIPTEELQNGTALGYRADYISTYSKRVVYEGLSIDSYRSMTRDEAYEALVSEKGIGPKVANCILLYGLHFMESYPIDTWMKKIISEDYGKSYPKQEDYLSYIGKSYPGYQGYIQQLQFYYKRKG